MILRKNHALPCLEATCTRRIVARIRSAVDPVAEALPAVLRTIVRTGNGTGSVGETAANAETGWTRVRITQIPFHPQICVIRQHATPIRKQYALSRFVATGT